jgi:hypothetical protein
VELKMTRREVALALVVMGVSFAVLYRVTEPKRQVQRRYTCYSNLKHIGLALLQYAEDNDDIFPRASYDGASSYKWMDAISPYVKNTDIFSCPSDNNNQPYRFRSSTSYGSYVMNNAYFLPGDNQTPPAGVRLERVASGAYTVLVTDGQDSFQCAWPDARRTPTLVGNNPFRFDSIRGRHGSGIIRSALAVGCDGSASTALQDFVRRTKMIRGQQIFTAFTIEGDEPWIKK